MYFQQLMKNELARRLSKNPRYSMRSFAKALDLDPGTASRILSGRQVPGSKIGQRICDHLGLKAEERERFFSSLAMQKKSSRLQRISPVFRKFLGRGMVTKARELSFEAYGVISEWYHSVILELPYVQGFKSDPRWIAAALGITETEAKDAVDRLVALGLMNWKEGELINTGGQLTTANKALTTASHRKNQRQFLERAISSLDNVPMNRRKMMRITMAIDPDKMPMANEMIYRFSRRLCRFLESGNRREVYTFSSALFPNQAQGRGRARVRTKAG